MSGDKKNCCEVMALALERRPANGLGLDWAIGMNMKTGSSREVIVYNFRRAKRTDTGKYGHGKPYANATFAPVKFCPFCGAQP